MALVREAWADRTQGFLRQANLGVQLVGELSRELRRSLVEWIERHYAYMGAEALAYRAASRRCKRQPQRGARPQEAAPGA